MVLSVPRFHSVVRRGTVPPAVGTAGRPWRFGTRRPTPRRPHCDRMFLYRTPSSETGTVRRVPSCPRTRPGFRSYRPVAVHCLASRSPEPPSVAIPSAFREKSESSLRGRRPPPPRDPSCVSRAVRGPVSVRQPYRTDARVRHVRPATTPCPVRGRVNPPPGDDNDWADRRPRVSPESVRRPAPRFDRRPSGTMNDSE